MSNNVEVTLEEKALAGETLTADEIKTLAWKSKALSARLGIAMAALVDVAETRQRIYTASEKAMRAQDAITTIRGMP